MRRIPCVSIGTAGSAAWPSYLALAAFAARQAPWPRSLAVLASAVLGGVALAALGFNLVRWLFAEDGLAARELGMPPEVARQVRRALLALVAGGIVTLVPCWVVASGYIAPEGRPVSAPALVRGLVLMFGLTVLGLAVWLLRRRSTLMVWLTEPPARLDLFARHRRPIKAALLIGIAGVIILDARGYSFSARRLASGAAGSLVAASLCWAFFRILARAIDAHAWRWVKVGQVFAGRAADDASVLPDDLAGRLRRLSAYLCIAAWLLMGAWVWDVDLALFRFISEQPLWSVDGKEVFVRVGDLARAALVLGLSALAWRHMSTAFAVVVFPRIPDDPGIRFALVTLCRYAVLGIGLLCGLSAIHLGLEKIGVVLAALGVGLGFGLQEIVSNFVCGIILLLERPIRVGDVVSVSGMTGTVDRINIRATSINNGDNQSIIVPNRAFITTDLINWTLKDKVIRVTNRVKVAHGADPDRVSDLLLAIARDDVDVLRNPVASALLEEISDIALVFALNVFVPEPSLAGRVKHRILGQIQRKFQDAGIPIALPTQELFFAPKDHARPRMPTRGSETSRRDESSPTPPAPWRVVPRPMAEPVEDCHRGVDE